MSGPTQGAADDNRTTAGQSWSASPQWARFTRLLLFVAPFAVAWAAVHWTQSFFFRPDGPVGAGLWLLQAMGLAVGVSAVIDRFTSRFLPLATLLGMSLTFPDQAPSRFGVALRSGTLRNLQRRIEEMTATGLDPDHALAARQAVELVTMLGRHERLTRGHTERVRAHADLIAVELGLDEEDRNKLAWASLLHDIGKLTVPAEILNKNGRPSDEEWAILKTHPAAGEAFIEPLADWLGDWRLATSEHHERWDGGGYPRGLAGEDISLAGRIVAAADAFDVITSKRSYKRAMPAEAARRELVKCSGTQFDPAIVRAMLRVSVGHQARTGRFGWLFELPRLAGVAQSAAVPAAAVVAVATASATLTTIPSASTAADALAFIDETAAAAPADPATEGGPGDGEPGDGGAGDESTTAPTTLPSTGDGSEPETTGPTTTSTGGTPDTTIPGTDGPGTSVSVTIPIDATLPTTLPLDETVPVVTVPLVTTVVDLVTTLLPSTVVEIVGPVAIADIAVAQPQTAVLIPVTANDIAGSSPLQTVTILSGPLNGTATVDGLSIRYTSGLFFLGIDNISYRVCDGNNRCATSTVAITVATL